MVWLRVLKTSVLWGLAAMMLACSATSRVRGRSTSAEQLYDASMEDMESGLYPEALRGFAEVKNKYPYSQYVALADLRVADTHFRRGRYGDSIDAYRNFLKYHPAHDQAPYAMLQIGEAYWEQTPSDWFFLPPAAEKDQASTRLAITAYRDMLARFGDAEVAEKARDRLRTARARLAEHELYVAQFYFKRDRYRASAARAEGLLESYAGLGYDLNALWIAAQSRIRLGEPSAARTALERLKTDYPNTAEGRAAVGLLEGLGDSQATATP